MPMMLQDLADMVQNPPGMQPPGQLPPGTPPNGLLANLMPLMQLGSVDQRHKLLQQQYDQAGQTAAGAPIDYSKGKGAPLALAGLVNLVSAGLGGYQQGKATGGLRDLVTQQDAGRTAAAQAVQAAPMSDLQSALMASPTDAPAKLQAAQDATGQRSKLGMLLGMTGDPQLAGMGKQLASEAGQDRETLYNMPQARQQLAGGDIKNQEGQASLQGALEKVRRAKADQDALENPATVAAMRSTAGKLVPGIDVSDVPPAALQHLIPLLEKVYAAKEAASARRDIATGNQNNKVNVAKINQGVVPGDDDGNPSALGGKMLQKRLDELQKDLDANGGRAGEMGKNQARVGAANRVLTLALDENGQPRNLTPQQMPELAQSVASLIANGGTSAQAQIEHLTPHTITGDINAKIQYLMNQPTGAGQQSFVANMAELAKREQTVAQQAMSKSRLQRLGRHAQLIKSNPDDVAPILTDYGIEIGADGKPTLAGQPAPTEAPAQKATHRYNPATGKIESVP